jgi:hypothetical protein
MEIKDNMLKTMPNTRRDVSYVHSPYMESKTQSEPGSRIVITRGWCNGQS